MELNPKLETISTETQYITTTTVERWVGYAEYLAIFIQVSAIVIAIFAANKANSAPITVSEGVTSLFFWCVVLTCNAYFVFLFLLAPLVLQARGSGQIMSSYIVILSTFISFFSILFGILFKIQSWDYASEILFLALFLSPLPIIIPIFYFIKDGKNIQTRNFIFNMIARIAGVFMFILGGIFIIIAYKALKSHFFKEKQ